jgi:hypothetical protein
MAAAMAAAALWLRSALEVEARGAIQQTGVTAHLPQRHHPQPQAEQPAAEGDQILSILMKTIGQTSTAQAEAEALEFSALDQVAPQLRQGRAAKADLGALTGLRLRAHLEMARQQRAAYTVEAEGLDTPQTIIQAQGPGARCELSGREIFGLSHQPAQQTNKETLCNTHN